MPTGDYEIVKVEDESPDRCQMVVGGKYQCSNKVVEGSQYCPSHGGASVATARKRQALQNYQLSVYNARFMQSAEEKRGSSEIKSLRDEIALTRALLEDLLNRCDSPLKMELQQGNILKHLETVEKLVRSAHKLELEMQQLLDREQIIAFGKAVINIISDIVQDQSMITEIASRIALLSVREHSCGQEA